MKVLHYEFSYNWKNSPEKYVTNCTHLIVLLQYAI